MSDGPHRSLPLRRHWKDLAARAATPSFSAKEVAVALPNALLKDLRDAHAPLSKIRNIFVGNESTLFHELCADQLETVRCTCRGVTAGTILVDCAIEANADGLTGLLAYRTSLINALEAIARGNCHSIEEHYQRKEPRSVENVRARLRTACDHVSYDALASEIIFGKTASTGKFGLTKHTGIDEGPQL